MLIPVRHARAGHEDHVEVLFRRAYQCWPKVNEIPMDVNDIESRGRLARDVLEGNRTGDLLIHGITATAFTET